MILRDHEHETVAAERIGFEPAGIDGAGDDAEIGDAFGDQADDLVAQALFQIDADIRMRGQETRLSASGRNSVSALVFDSTRIWPASPPP